MAIWSTLKDALPTQNPGVNICCCLFVILIILPYCGWLRQNPALGLALLPVWLCGNWPWHLCISSWLCFFEILDAGAVVVCFSILGSCMWKTCVLFSILDSPLTSIILMKLPARLLLLEHLEARTHIALMYVPHSFTWELDITLDWHGILPSGQNLLD